MPVKEFRGVAMLRSYAMAGWIAVAVVLSAPHAEAQFTTGSLVVLRVGEGVSALNNTGTAVFLDQFNTTGSGQTANYTLAMPTVTSGAINRLVMSGSASSEGQLTLSLDKTKIVVAGYDAALGTASVASSTSATVARVVNGVDSEGTVSTLATTSVNFSGNNFRSAYSNGTNVWAVGGATGLALVPENTVVSTTNNVSNRVVASFNGNIYTTTGSGTRGVYRVGTGGFPTTAATGSTAISGTTSATSSPYAFVFDAAGTTLYVADDRTVASGGGIQKYTSSDGGATFTLAGTFTGGIGQTAGFRGLTADFSGANPILYATSADTASKLVSLTDDASLGAANFTQNQFVLATAGANTAFRSVVFAPVPVPEPGTILGLSAAGMIAAGWMRRRRRD
jgi:hypothetical protein